MGYLQLGPDLNRRVFIKDLGYIGLGVLVGTSFGGCEDLLRQIANRPTRRRLRTGSPEVDAAIATYREAVHRMKQLSSADPGDPLGWTAQASIHGTSSGFQYCQHGNYGFFPWHRAYLVYLERICQKLTGEKSFGLPYWNWNQDPAMHPAFTADPSSPLYHTRSNTDLSGTWGASAVSDATLDPMFGDGNFYTFSTQIEGTPHNTVHGAVGGDMAGYTSAFDPIFFMHHCMVDFCWAKWNLELGNDNTNDASWTQTNWTHFVDADGNPASVTSGVTTVMPLLSYQYESSAIGSSPAVRLARTKAEFDSLRARIEKGANVRLNIKRRIPIAQAAKLPVGRPFSRSTRVSAGDLNALIEAATSREHVFARVAYAQLPPNNDFFVRVFINLPSASPETPISDPHYAGSFAFFGTQMPETPNHSSSRHFLVDLGRTLRNLRERQQLSAERPLSVQLVAVPTGEQLVNKEAQLQLEGVELIVTPVVVQAGQG